ncbi:hypothetical protein FAEPRAM212_02894 [Faecalibacterium prausnitzii M21/2]|uniref:Uncharacterized protein n=1 Tax=Faecalibacterium prausnitzii M21/2 TaxID=411485 RepID=A8SFY7_9FIRM|nr:hypothetical protein FAEPRAM212_02894 [Faecalibacterium prausnitzii M21/2]
MALIVPYIPLALSHGIKGLRRCQKGGQRADKNSFY